MSRALRSASFAFSTLLFAAAGCSSGAGENKGDPSGAGAGSSSSGSSSGQGGAGGDVISTGAGGESAVSLTVTPANSAIAAVWNQVGPTVQFKATTKTSDAPVDAVWTLSSPTVGTIDGEGLFTASGKAGGEVTVTATLGSVQGSTKLTVNLTAEEGGELVTDDEKAALKGPGQSDAAFRIVYPYDKTVFPRGILAPEIHQSGGGAGTKFYVKITTSGMLYEGFYNPSGQLVMSQDAWESLGASAAGAAAKVEVSKLVGGVKYGPVEQTWRLANGKLIGTVYYNTYNSSIAAGGAMMRVKGSSAVPEVLLGQCRTCHSISADGSTAASANHSGNGGTFDLSSGNLNPPLVWQESELAAFAGLYPKGGEVLVINGAPGSFWPPNTPGTSGTSQPSGITPPYTSALRTKNGTLIQSSGIEPYYAMTPAFSHDGTKLAFCNRAGSSPYASSLAMMDYDAVAQKFTNLQVMAVPPAGRHYSFPAFTPDGKFLVYQDGVGEDLLTWNNNTAKFYAIDLATKQTIALGSVNGDGYMPAGARDENLNFEPSFAPVASGGYFWMTFTSRRTWGNRLVGSRGETKRIWVAAASINPNGGEDFSNPAFYIAGQEINSNNSRGFFANDPCKPNGETCESGADCCEGFCGQDPSDPTKFVCGPPSGRCSNEFESCATAADCCDPELLCINNKCAQQAPPN